jgi:cytochrome c oxidase cbb3-type subunit 4
VDLGTIHTIWTVLLVVIFVGIVLWAWNGRQQARFDRAARSVLDDEMDSRRLPLSPGGRGQGVKGEALREEPNVPHAASFTRGENNHG